MNRREDALREALVENTNEVERWEAYRKENETAIENLNEFSKHLTVEVMVPLGKKAFMPGHLIHTNEVLIGHYQGYFSKCSAYKAKEICVLRINRAKEYLQKLETEAEFWQNKLEKPYLEGVLPSAGEREIIEDYNEEEETRWREQHKLNLKRAKLQEKAERQRLDEAPKSKSDDDIFKMLEDAELMEELENEIENLEVDEISDEAIRKLMAGEMVLPKQKTRMAHNVNNKRDSKLEGIVKKAVSDFPINQFSATNNNTRTNPDIAMMERDHMDVVDDDLSQEVKLIKEQAQYLPVIDQIGFYEYQLEIVRKKIAQWRMVNESDMEEKLHLLTVLEELEDLLAMIEEQADSIDEANEVSETANDEKPTEIEKLEKLDNAQQKRRIKFALEDQTLLFRHNEAVSQMLPKIVDNNIERQRDVITLDDKVKAQKTEIAVNKKQSIMERVEKNRQQSEQNCDLVAKIIDEFSQIDLDKTIHITFQHSPAQAASDYEESATSSTTTAHDEEVIPGKPSDFYDLYLKQLQKPQNVSTEPTHVYVNGYIGEDAVKTPILRENKHLTAYEDPRTEFFNPKNAEADNIANKAKSILRNKSAVEMEKHVSVNTNVKSKKKQSIPLDEEEYMSAYYKVMNEVIEKPLTEPEPLPVGKYIDAHAPKKRVSRFKQMRTGVEKT